MFFTFISILPVRSNKLLFPNDDNLWYIISQKESTFCCFDNKPVYVKAIELPSNFNEFFRHTN